MLTAYETISYGNVYYGSFLVSFSEAGREQAGGQVCLMVLGCHVHPEVDDAPSPPPPPVYSVKVFPVS